MLLIVGFFAIGLIASAAVPALAQASGTWTTTGNLNNPSSRGPLILLANGQVLTVGTGSAELYNPATGNWTVTGSTATPRTGHTATLLPNGEVLVEGGYLGNGVYTATAEVYNPLTGQWRPTGNMMVPRDLHSATLLQNGKVLVAGGTNADNGLSSGNTAELAVGFG
jgi:N-acetylneuraminic acid mutarotase